MPLKYSVLLPNGAARELAGIKDPVEAYEAMTHVAQTAEDAGFNAVWLFDALWPIDLSGVSLSSQDTLFECWTTTAALARDTTRIRIGQIVTCNAFRHPALLAKMAATGDVISHGRLTVGIGTGPTVIASQCRAYGYDYPDAPIRSHQLREAILILLAMWTQEEAVFEGQYYQISGAINQPKGVQRPHIPLLIDGNEQTTLKLAAEYGNACNVLGEPAALKHKYSALKQHCEAVGRDYESIHRTAGSVCIIEDTDEQALAKLPDTVGARMAMSALVGSPATIRERIVAYEDAGVQELVLRFPETMDLDTIRRMIQRFGQEVKEQAISGV